jgi:hypothetical protein
MSYSIFKGRGKLALRLRDYTRIILLRYSHFLALAITAGVV